MSRHHGTFTGWLIWLALLLVPIQVAAHDLGVSQASLTELPNNGYRLRVETGPALASLFQTPRLPEHCGFVSEPIGQRAVDAVLWELRCTGRGLTAGDSLFLPWQREGVMLRARWADGSGTTAFFPRRGDGMTVSLEQLEAGSGSFWQAAKRYLVLGVEHIALGIDHLLFVLCLLLVVQSTWPLVKTITAFTLAHSITLALATLGLVQVSSAPVEASIALSIVFLAAEILRHRRPDAHLTLTYRAPWLIAFGFGLLHGLGFAGALAAIGLPRPEIPVALLFFNLGVEIGQLMFVTLILLLAWLLQRLRPRWPDWTQQTPVYLVGILASYWLLQRVGGMLGV